MKALGPRILLCVVVASLASQPLSGGLVRQCSLTTLATRATTILRGRCLRVTAVRDATPVPYIEYTFDVLEALKGCRGDDDKVLTTIVFRHVSDRLAQERPDGFRVAALRLGVPRYRKGEEVVLFLTGESHLGLCSPLGLAQGVFRVHRQDGLATLKNDCANRGLFSGMTSKDFSGDASGELQQLRSLVGPIELQRFLHLCRSLAVR